MTDEQARAYAVIALWRMLNNESIRAAGGSLSALAEIDEEVKWLVGIMTGDQAEAKAKSILAGRL